MERRWTGYRDLIGGSKMRARTLSEKRRGDDCISQSCSWDKGGQEINEKGEAKLWTPEKGGGKRVGRVGAA